MPNRYGFTLVELIITLFVISVAILGTVFAFMKTGSLTQDMENIIAADSYVEGEMENIRSENFDDITEPETTVTVWLGPPVSASTQVSVKIVNASSSFTSHTHPGKEIKRAVTFYIYKKGINYRQ